MKSGQIEASIEDLFRKRVKKDDKIHNAFLMVHSEKLGINMNVAEGLTDGKPSNPNQPYFIASVSKLFAAVLTAIFVEQGKLSFEDYITSHLDAELLSGMHIIDGRDYIHEVKIRHLLNHTSGLHDILEDTPKNAKGMRELIFEEPDRTWTPRSVLEWAKNNLTSHFPPGKGFHYSDTGYHLLGLIIEKVSGMPYHEALTAYIFEPCGMDHSSFANYSEPKVKPEHPLANLYGRNMDVSKYRCLTLMFAGGAIISTTNDQLKFMKALVNGELISSETREQMKDWAKFFFGIDYGYGMMNFKTIPILMPKKYNAWGNAGSTGTFLFYHPSTESYVIGGLNEMTYGQKGIRFMLKVVDKLTK
ncbi:serine hydrolase domain-containing protein [Bacillus sp. FJAT-27245]|uniref:serine hydrolase domain-containing protein n=1 Tax=Bacillus sp. FJAT-27245 TaxID=1684144 RepID=UPI0006A78B3B|nr:serine hydrolase domain-containing protein [Bacillus sp. FJAT-27245]